VLAVHGNELAAYALQLREARGGGRQLNGLLNILDLDLAPSFALVVLLVCHDLCEDIGRGFVEFVEIILLGCRLLLEA
jgi:hypothetical protein